MFSTRLQGHSSSDGPEKPSSGQRQLRSPKSLKHRFELDEDEDGHQGEPSAAQPSPKRRTHMFAPFGRRVDNLRADPDDVDGDDDEYFSDASSVRHSDRRRRRRSSSTESPLARELEEKYSDLRIALHSDAVTKLEDAQEEMTTEATTKIKANREGVAVLGAAYGQLVAPISTAKVSTTLEDESSSDGVRSGDVVDMADFVPAFEAHVEAASAELEKQWASWEEAQAEIEALGRELLPRRVEEQDASGKTELDRALEEMETQHSKVLAGYQAELEDFEAGLVAEMRQYEKEMLKQINSEASKILQIFFDPEI